MAASACRCRAASTSSSRSTRAGSSGLSGSASAVRRSRARSTSASRAAPSTPASQRSSARSGRDQVLRSNGLKVRRSLRRRRQATRIWCTAVSPPAAGARSRTSGSCANSRRISLRTASVTTSPAVGSAGSPAGATRSGSACAVAPSARTCFGVNDPPWAPASRSTPPTRSSSFRSPALRSTSTSRNVSVVAPASSSTVTRSSTTSASTVPARSHTSYACRTVRTTVTGASGAPGAGR